jgi:hypothetical protein
MTPEAVAMGDDALNGAWAFLQYFGGKTDGEYAVVKRWAVENGLGFAQLPLYDDPDVQAAFGSWGDVDVISQQAELARSKEGLTPWFGAWDVFTQRGSKRSSASGPMVRSTTWLRNGMN